MGFEKTHGWRLKNGSAIRGLSVMVVVEVLAVAMTNALRKKERHCQPICGDSGQEKFSDCPRPVSSNLQLAESESGMFLSN
jgi:hypothetical protein